MYTTGVMIVLLQVFFYSQSIFENAQVQPDYIPFAVMATNAVNVVMTLVAVSCPISRLRYRHRAVSHEISK